MSQAIVDPEELRRFAHNLKKFNGALEEQLAALNGQMESLAATWRDQEYQKFAEEFSTHLRHFSRFIEVTNEQIPFLMRKASRIEDYLDQR